MLKESLCYWRQGHIQFLFFVSPVMVDEVFSSKQALSSSLSGLMSSFKLACNSNSLRTQYSFQLPNNESKRGESQKAPKLIKVNNGILAPLNWEPLFSGSVMAWLKPASISLLTCFLFKDKTLLSAVTSRLHVDFSWLLLKWEFDSVDKLSDPETVKVQLFYCWFDLWLKLLAPACFWLC